MSDKLSDVAARIVSVQQLSTVVSAMRGIAAARSREARERLEGVRAYAQTVATAIGEALAYLGSAPPGSGNGGRHAIIAFCAEQGFVGVFNERVLDRVAAHVAPAQGGSEQLMLVGDRGLMSARERGLAVAWSTPMIAHTGQAAALANRIVEEIYRRIESEGLTRVSMIHAVPGPSAQVEVRETQLIPFDFARFPPDPHRRQPLFTLRPELLLTRLVEEYVFAELCEAVVLSFAAENEARMRSMIMARSNVTRTLETLRARSRQLRQEEITDEILELAESQTRSR